MFKKSMGQHFLKCQWVAQTMIKTADLGTTDTVLEIGPGTGALTRELIKHAGRVIAIEKDEKLAENLKSALKKEGAINIKIITGDVLEFLSSPNAGRQILNTKYKVVANIPYYLTSRLLRLLLESNSRPELIVLTIQK